MSRFQQVLSLLANILYQSFLAEYLTVENLLTKITQLILTKYQAINMSYLHNHSNANSQPNQLSPPSTKCVIAPSSFFLPYTSTYNHSHNLETIMCVKEEIQTQKP